MLVSAWRLGENFLQRGGISAFMGYDDAVLRRWPANVVWTSIAPSYILYATEFEDNSQYWTPFPSPPVSVTWKSGLAAQAARSRSLAHARWNSLGNLTSTLPRTQATRTICRPSKLGKRCQACQVRRGEGGDTPCLKSRSSIDYPADK